MAKNQKSGMALFLVIITLVLVAIVSTEIFYSSLVDIKISSNAKKRLQAYYVAQSAAKIALLRVVVYKELENIVGGQNSQVAKAVNAVMPPQVRAQIWSAPLPAFPLPGQREGEVKKTSTGGESSEAGEGSEYKTKMAGTMTHLIRSEGSKIPINLLDKNPNRGSSEDHFNEVLRQLKNLWEGMLEEEDFEEAYGEVEIEDLINPLADWVDADDSAIDGGSEERDYGDVDDPPYKPRNNRISNLEELYLVKGWSDRFIKILGPELSVLNNQLKINPNYISLERLKTIHPPLSSADLSRIQLKRNETPFRDLKEMESFIREDIDIENGRDFPSFEELGYETTEREQVFSIEATGSVGNARRTIKLGVRIDDDGAKAPVKENSVELGLEPTEDEDQDGVPNQDDQCPRDGRSGMKDSDKDGCEDVSENKKAKLFDPRVITIEESSL